MDDKRETNPLHHFAVEGFRHTEMVRQVYGTPPGIYLRSENDSKGRPRHIFRKVYVDRDKYSPLKGINIDGHAKTHQARAEAEARAEAGDEEVAERKENAVG